MNQLLQKYVHRFSKMRQGQTKYGLAPHKPVLLLAVLRGVEEGWIVENRIELSPKLVGTFKTIWGNIVTTEHSPLIAQPFFYLRSEKFWKHVPNPGYENWVQITKNCKSIGVLNKAVAYAQFDPDLFELIMSPLYRAVLIQSLFKTFFPDSDPKILDRANYYYDQIANQILEESPLEYQTEIQSLLKTLDKNSFEEEVFVRSGVFKRQVPLIYNNTCCISGLRVETTVNASLVDACHIVPFSQSHDDTISNGLSLCPTLHRAFDRGLIAIDPDRFTVLVSKRLGEPVKSVYSILQFAGNSIQLPSNEKYYPAQKNLQAHLTRYADNF